MLNRAIAPVAALAFLLSSTAVLAAPTSPFGDPTTTKSIRLEQRLPRPIVDPGAPGVDPLLTTVGPATFAPSPRIIGNQPHPDTRVVRSFEVLGDYDTRLIGRALIPPDTMGAVGNTQYVQFINGAFSVFDKNTGLLLGATSDVGFWNQLGQIGTGGDPRVLYHHQMDRWLAIGFGADTKNLNIAVSETSDALGNWRATNFEGIARVPGVNPPVPPATVGTPLSALADYPTLAMDNNAVYIGTNNFRQEVPGGPNGYRGTTLHVIPLADIFAATGPTVTNKVSFVTPFVSGSPTNDTTRGFSIQGVNSNEAGDGTGTVVAASAFINGTLAYDILNAGTPGATQGAATILDQGYLSNNAARQPGRPDALTKGPLRNIDTLDDRIGTNAWEVGGNTYYVHTVSVDEAGTTTTADDYTVVRITVFNTDTKAVIQTLDIGETGYDFYMGSIAVSKPTAAGGRAIVGFNRSGTDPADGRITFMARSFSIMADGTLRLNGKDIVIRESNTPGYMNGDREITGVPVGRQRWGDYSAVTLDPNDPYLFWAIGQFAQTPYEVTRPGYPVASGFSRWGQYVVAIQVPEPGSVMTMFGGLAALGAIVRARRTRR